MSDDYSRGRHNQPFSGGDWDAFQHGRNDRARWDAHVADRDKPAGGFAPPGGFGAPGMRSGAGGAGGGGLAVGIVLLVVALFGFFLFVPAALLAMAVTPFLVALGLRRGEFWSLRTLYLPVLKACAAFVVLQAGGIALLVFGADVIGLDAAEQTGALIAYLGALSGGRAGGVGSAPLLSALAGTGLMLLLGLIVPVLGMAAVLRTQVEGYARPLGFGKLLGFTVLSLAGGLVVVAGYVVVFRLAGGMLPVEPHTWLPGTVVVSAVIAAATSGLFALLFSRRTGVPRGALFRLAAPAVFLWALLCGLNYYGFRAADPFVVQFLYPASGLEPGALAALPVFLLMQLPGALFLWRWIVSSDFWRPGRGPLVISLILLGLGNGVGWAVLCGVVRFFF